MASTETTTPKANTPPGTDVWEQSDFFINVIPKYDHFRCYQNSGTKSIRISYQHNFQTISSFCRSFTCGIAAFATNDLECTAWPYGRTIEKIFEDKVSKVSHCDSNLKSSIDIFALFGGPQTDLKTFFRCLYKLMTKVYKSDCYYFW